MEILSSWDVVVPMVSCSGFSFPFCSLSHPNVDSLLNAKCAHDWLRANLA